MNRLASEKSPYLIQHRHNPVDWYPWGGEAFEKAAREEKPVFLSIGYSTCHWCHVMERESFEDPATAELLNKHFVSIKVDREERPDLDAVYMAYVQATTGSGGWPMSVFLTAERKPFYGGTYFPPTGRQGMPGFKDLLNGIAEAWTARRDEILKSAASAAEFLNRSQGHSHAPAALDEALLKHASAEILSHFDAANGGFGRAPKFPMPNTLCFLLRAWKRFGDAEALAAVEKTLDAMAEGGICDRIGGGFHRYSTDAEWRVPHYEKMLYDQALLASAYVEAYLAVKSPRYADVARRTLDYVLRDMTDPRGGFYSAEDADSKDENGELREGAYYECTAEQRAKLPRPHLDDKVLTDWNGLMITALADASRALGEPRYLAAAEKAADFILKTLRDKEGRLLHRYRDGEAAFTATLDDYAFMIRALTALYEASFNRGYLDEARKLAGFMTLLFGDTRAGGFYMTEAGAADVIARPKSDYDGAIPSGNSMAAAALERLGRLLEDETLTAVAQRTLEHFAAEAAAHPAGFAQMLSALDLRLGPAVDVVIGCDALDETAKSMIQKMNSRFLPHATLRLDAARKVRNGTAAHVCRHSSCLPPVLTAEALEKLLD